MSDTAFNRALATVLNRLLDRFLPPLRSPRTVREKCGLWLSAFLGTFTMGAAATLYGFAAKSDPGSLVSRILAVFTNGSQSDYRVDTDFLWLVPVLVAPMMIMFTLLIISSFNRGRPLTFYLWGLAFPALAAKILRLAFETSKTTQG